MLHFKPHFRYVFFFFYFFFYALGIKIHFVSHYMDRHGEYVLLLLYALWCAILKPILCHIMPQWGYGAKMFFSLCARSGVPFQTPPCVTYVPMWRRVKNVLLLMYVLELNALNRNLYHIMSQWRLNLYICIYLSTL